jgi:hypothetical protein
LVNIIKSIVSSYHWTIDKIDILFCDENDYYGIGFWYNELVEESKQLKKT